MECNLDYFSVIEGVGEYKGLYWGGLGGSLVLRGLPLWCS